MSKRETGQRVFILVMVGAFVISSFAFSAFVIWDLVKNNNKNTTTADLQKQLDELQKSQNKKLKGFTPVSKVDSLKTVDLKKGNGKIAKKDSTVTVQYTGALAKDGTIFDSSVDLGKPATFPLPKVIKGWQLGVPGMREGGKRRLFIPSSLAYGQQGSPPKIGPNEPLVFDIELISVK